MSYWCDDARLDREQRKLDAMQDEAKRKIDEKRRQAEKMVKQGVTS